MLCFICALACTVQNAVRCYNARRFGIDMGAYPTLQRIDAACLALPAFDAARPERQPDAPASA